MSRVQEISAQQLKQMDRRRFDAEYLKWVDWQWQDDWYVENATQLFYEKYKSNGIEIERLNYSISFSQGDYASFSGRVFLTEWMETVRVAPDGPTYAERYPALFAACKEDGSYMNVTGEDRRTSWRATFNEGWSGVAPCGIFANMSEADWDELVEEQAGEADVETEVLKYCDAIGGEIYDHLSDVYLEATSEEAFLDSCEANEVTFEVEIDEEECHDEICCEDQ